MNLKGNPGALPSNAEGGTAMQELKLRHRG
jgi:hypothetical protein